MRKAVDMSSGFAGMSTLARWSSSLATTARFAAAVTYTRMVVTRSTYNNMCCCPDKTTFDISVVKHSPTY
eukprot:6557644-Pyramimonas_sp.AAC.1